MAVTGKGLPRSLANANGAPGGSASASKAVAQQFARLSRTDLNPVPVLASGVTAKLIKGGTGLATVSVTAGGTGYVVGDILSVTGGTSSFPAQLRVSSVNAGVITAVSIYVPGVYSAAPAAPLAVSGGTGSGATFGGTFTAAAATSVNSKLSIGRADVNIDFLGYDPKDVTTSYRGNGVQNGTQACISFDSDAPRIDFRLIGLNSNYDLYVDDQRIATTPVQTDSSGGAYIYTVDWAGDAKIRRYRLCGINTAFGGLFIPSTYSILKPTGFLKPLVWQMGDSYTLGVGATQASYNDFHVMCDLLGLEGIADGISGAGWTSTQDERIPEYRVRTKLGAITRKPDYVFLAMGYNDNAADPTRIEPAFRPAVAAVREIVPDAKIIVIGAATPLGATAGLDAVRAEIMALSSELGLTYIDMNNVVNANNSSIYTGSDNIHPSNAGHVFRGTMLGRFVSAVL